MAHFLLVTMDSTISTVLVEVHFYTKPNTVTPIICAEESCEIADLCFDLIEKAKSELMMCDSNSLHEHHFTSSEVYDYASNIIPKLTYDDMGAEAMLAAINYALHNKKLDFGFEY